MQQVRVKVGGKLFGQYEYLFKTDRPAFLPVFDEQQKVCAQGAHFQLLSRLKLVPPEDKEWHLVRGLERSDTALTKEYLAALNASNPESGNFVLYSLRRRRMDDKK